MTTTPILPIEDDESDSSIYDVTMFATSTFHKRFPIQRRTRSRFARFIYVDSIGPLTTFASLSFSLFYCFSTDYTSEDEEHMTRAIELANTVTYEDHTSPNPIVGCVIVDPATNDVVGEGYHPKAGEPHAEVYALRAAGKKARGATAYVTLEPCNHFGRTAACSRALVDAGVKRVLIGAYDTDPRVAGGGMQTLLDRGVEVVCGCKEKEATEMNRAFFDRIEKERIEKEQDRKK